MNILIAGEPEFTVNYEAALKELGVSFEVSLHPLNIARFDGLLLPGGGDINPDFYGESVTASSNINTVLDEQQFSILHQFVLAKKPILGICKGIQVINVYFGGSLIQDIETASLHRWNEKDMIHTTLTRPDSFLIPLYGTQFVTNSAHHQAIGLLGRHLQVAQVSPDNIIEAVCHNSLPIIGVQWHPERMCFANSRRDTVDGSLLLRYFLQLCSQTNALM